MTERNTSVPKKRGPPKTGWGTPIQVRVHDDLLSALDAFIAARELLDDKKLTRPEAARLLMKVGLEEHGLWKPEG